MSVLALLVVMTSQIVTSIIQVIGVSTDKMDALSQANIALNRLDTDLRRAMKRSDLLPYFNSQSGSDELWFYSHVPAYEGERTLSVVAYRVHSTSTSSVPVLQRGTTGSSWLASDTPAAVSFTQDATAHDVAVADADWQTVASGVFRMEIAFTDRTTGAFKKKPESADWSDVGGLLVTVAVLDARSRMPLGSNEASAINSMASALVDFDGTNIVYPLWQKVAQLTPAISGIPAVVQGRLRIVQRFYEW